jgi:hypothetical protein
MPETFGNRSLAGTDCRTKPGKKTYQNCDTQTYKEYFGEEHNSRSKSGNRGIGQTVLEGFET